MVKISRRIISMLLCLIFVSSYFSFFSLFIRNNVFADGVLLAKAGDVFKFKEGFENYNYYNDFNSFEQIRTEQDILDHISLSDESYELYILEPAIECNVTVDCNGETKNLSSILIDRITIQGLAIFCGFIDGFNSLEDIAGVGYVGYEEEGLEILTDTLIFNTVNIYEYTNNPPKYYSLNSKTYIDKSDTDIYDTTFKINEDLYCANEDQKTLFNMVYEKVGNQNGNVLIAKAGDVFKFRTGLEELKYHDFDNFSQLLTEQEILDAVDNHLLSDIDDVDEFFGALDCDVTMSYNGNSEDLKQLIINRFKPQFWTISVIFSNEYNFFNSTGPTKWSGFMAANGVSSSGGDDTFWGIDTIHESSIDALEVTFTFNEDLYCSNEDQKTLFYLVFEKIGGEDFEETGVNTNTIILSSIITLVLASVVIYVFLPKNRKNKKW